MKSCLHLDLVLLEKNWGTTKLNAQRENVRNKTILNVMEILQH